MYIALLYKNRLAQFCLIQLHFCITHFVCKPSSTSLPHCPNASLSLAIWSDKKYLYDPFLQPRSQGLDSPFLFCQKLIESSRFKRTQSWRRILKKNKMDKKDKMEKMKEKEDGKLDGANSGSDSSISQTSTTSSTSIGGKRTNGKGMVQILALFCGKKSWERIASVRSG